MKFDVNVLAAGEKGACCLRTTASSTVEGFWLPRANCQWSGDVRDVDAPAPWKSFASQPQGQSELWLRPGWKAAEIWPDQITVPKTPALNPKTAEQRKAYHDAMARKRKSARIMEAKGYRQETATKGTMAGAKVWKRA